MIQDEFMEQLSELPLREDEVWQGGLVRMPVWISGEEADPFQPYMALWVAIESATAHGGEILRPDELDPQYAIDSLLDFALRSEHGGYRPGTIEVREADLADRLSRLSELDIDVQLVDQLEAVDLFLDEMTEAQESEESQIPGPLDAKGVTVERMRSFADAASDFCEAKPWVHLTDFDLIRVDGPKPPSGMKYITVLGAAGEVFGLGIYGTLRDFWRLVQAIGSVGGSRPGCWSLSLDPIENAEQSDVDLWEQFELPYSSNRLVPVVMGFPGSGVVNRPNATQLNYLEGLLRALSETTEEEIDSGQWQKKVSTYSGPKSYRLTLPDLLKPPTPQEWYRRGYDADRRAFERTAADMDRYFRKHPPANDEEMSRVMRQLFNHRNPTKLVTEPETPNEQAQDLCYQAFDIFGRRRVHLARKALEISPDCADAYTILAEQTGSLETSIELYEQGLAVAERVLGEKAFQEPEGEFWLELSTRPYMRARLGLALALAEADRVADAVPHYQELLRLNPDDNLNVRSLLLPALLELERDLEAARLLKTSNEESTTWAYGRALLAFRLSENREPARRELRRAFETNSYVAEILARKHQLRASEMYATGSLDEAIECSERLRYAFAKTEGALEWLAEEEKLWFAQQAQQSQ